MSRRGTGDPANDENVRRALGLEAKDAIGGFIYLGTRAQSIPPAQTIDPQQFVVEWPASDG